MFKDCADINASYSAYQTNQTDSPLSSVPASLTNIRVTVNCFPGRSKLFRILSIIIAHDHHGGS